jgi:hypothetical protein
MHVGSSKNTINTIRKKMGRIDTMIAFSVLFIVVILFCASLAISCRELGQPIFLEDISGLIHIFLITMFQHLVGNCR